MTASIIHLPVKAVRRRAAPRRMALTENRVLDLRGVGFVFDTKVAGLAVRITANEAKTYVYQRKLKGRPVRIALGKCAGLRLDAARAAVERLNGQVAAGVDLKAERAQAKAAERLTVELH